MKDSPVLNCSSFHENCQFFEKLSKNSQDSRGSFDSGNWSLVLDKMPRPKAWVQKCQTTVQKIWIKSLLLVSFPPNKHKSRNVDQSLESALAVTTNEVEITPAAWYSKRADSSLLCAPFASSSTTKPACDHV